MAKRKYNPLFQPNELRLGAKKIAELRFVLHNSLLNELIDMEIENRMLKAYFNVGNNIGDVTYRQIHYRYEKEIKNAKNKLLPQSPLKFSLKEFEEYKKQKKQNKITKNVVNKRK